MAPDRSVNIIGRQCHKGCGRQARALSDLCGLCYAGARALERVLDAWVWTADACPQLVRR